MIIGTRSPLLEPIASLGCQGYIDCAIILFGSLYGFVMVDQDLSRCR